MVLLNPHRIPKGQSVAVHRRRTDFTIPTRQMTNNHVQQTTQKTKYQATRTLLHTCHPLL